MRKRSTPSYWIRGIKTPFHNLEEAIAAADKLAATRKSAGCVAVYEDQVDGPMIRVYEVNNNNRPCLFSQALDKNS